MSTPATTQSKYKSTALTGVRLLPTRLIRMSDWQLARLADRLACKGRA